MEIKFKVGSWEVTVRAFGRRYNGGIWIGRPDGVFEGSYKGFVWKPSVSWKPSLRGWIDDTTITY